MTDRREAIVAFDPGAAGAVAILTAPTTIYDAWLLPIWKPRGKSLVQAYDLRKRIGDKLEELPDWQVEFVLEQCVPFQKGHAHAMFQLGRSLGTIEGIAGTFGFPMHWVTPNLWKGSLGLGKNKANSIDRATATFGQEAKAKWWPLKKHEGVCEAALIGHYHLRR